MTRFVIKGDGELDALRGRAVETLPFAVPVDSFLHTAHRSSHLLTLTALEIRERIGRLDKIKVGDEIVIGQFMGDVLPTWARLTDIDVSVKGEPGLVLNLNFDNGFVPAAPLYIDRERSTIGTAEVPAVCDIDLAGDLNAISGGTNTHSGEHLIATFDGNAVANRVTHATRAYFTVVALPAPVVGAPLGTPDQLRGGLVIKLAMNFIDRSKADAHNICPCGADRV